jgi:hypothetical protein
VALTLTVLILALVNAAAAGAAEPAQIAGKITKLPPETAGGRTVQVVAIHLPDGAIVDADRADDGRYSVSVPKGFNALLTQVIPFGGAKATSVLSAAIKAKPGEQVKLKLRAKKRKRHHPGHHGRESAKVGSAARVVAEDGKVYPGESVALKTFTGATGGWSALNNGLPDMLVTDLANPPAGCEYTQVEYRRLDVIEREIALGQSGLVDPDSAVQPGHRIPVELFIEGTLSNAFDPPAPLRYEIRIVEAATGTVRTTLEGILGGDGHFFDDATALGQRVVAAVCAGPTVCALRASSCGGAPPVGAPRYTGPISGHYKFTGGGPTPLEIDWSGNVELALTNEFSSPPYGSGLPEPGPYAHYETRSGSVHASLTYTDLDGCAWAGETDIAITPGAPYGVLDAQEGAAEPAYRLGIAAGPSDSIPFTKSGPGCTSSPDDKWPLYNLHYAATPTPQTAQSSTLAGSATYSIDPTQTENWTWNLTPGT